MHLFVLDQYPIEKRATTTFRPNRAKVCRQRLIEEVYTTHMRVIKKWDPVVQRQHNLLQFLHTV